MKFSLAKTIQAAVLVAFSVFVCSAQTVPEKAPEPNAIGVFFYLDSASSTLKRLPQEEFRRHTSTGFSSVTQSVMVSGEGSSLHVADTQPTFVFQVFKEEEASRAKLFQFNVKGSDREYDLSKWHHKETTTNTGLPLNVARYGQSSFKLTPESPLAPGEYALTLGPTVFTFSVSGK
ncbi:MAG TPA: hypothetical protein VJ731_01880 [Terriglobales bacterium]|nr:hypothetical protein [Terriglobales bacterium]